MLTNGTATQIRSTTKQSCGANNSSKGIPKMKSGANKLVRRQPMAKACSHVELGQVVLCSYKGWPEWPALVTGFEKNMINIEFFGDHTTFKAALKHFFVFEESHEVINRNIKRLKKPLYKKAVMEAEVLLKVPPEHSIFNQF